MARGGRCCCRRPTGFRRRKTIRQRPAAGGGGAGDDGSWDAGADGSLDRRRPDATAGRTGGGGGDVPEPEGKVKSPDDWQTAGIGWD